MPGASVVLGFLIQKAAGCAGIVMKTRSSNRGLEFEPSWIKLMYLIHLNIFGAFFRELFSDHNCVKMKKIGRRAMLEKNRPENLCQNMMDSIFLEL